MRTKSAPSRGAVNTESSATLSPQPPSRDVSGDSPRTCPARTCRLRGTSLRSAVAEVVCGGERGADVARGDRPRERAETLERVDDDVPVVLDVLEPAAHEQERL